MYINYIYIYIFAINFPIAPPKIPKILTPMVYTFTVALLEFPRREAPAIQTIRATYILPEAWLITRLDYDVPCPLDFKIPNSPTSACRPSTIFVSLCRGVIGTLCPMVCIHLALERCLVSLTCVSYIKRPPFVELDRAI